MWRKFQVKIETTAPLLGTQPTEESLRKAYLQTEEDEEVLPAERPKTSFYSHNNELVLMNYQMKGWFKDAFSELPHLVGIKGRTKEWASGRVIKSRIDKWLFVRPRFISMGRTAPDGSVTVQNGQKPDGSLIRPLRAETRQGQRVTPVESDKLDPPITLSFVVKVLENSPITLEKLEKALPYGEEYGLLQWRSAGWGTFKVIELIELKEAKA